MEIIVFLLLAVVALAALYAVYAYWAYHRQRPRARACATPENSVEIDDYRLHFRIVGEDRGLPPVVLIHGGPGHSSLSFKSAFDFLSDQTRVVYYDQRGSGASEEKPRPADYTIEHLVEELDHLREQALHAERVILIGHSFGGALAQRYALRYPERVAKMALVGGIRVNNGMSSRWVWKWLGPALYSTALGFPPAEAPAADDWFTHSSEKDNPKRLHNPAQSALLDGMGRLSFIPWREISLSLTGPDYKTELSRLPVPTLFAYGLADSPYTGKPVADELCALLPNASAVAFERSGHWPYLEEPERFQQVIRAFLQA